MKNPKFMQGHCLIQLCKRSCLGFWPMVANIATLPCLISVSRRLQVPKCWQSYFFENISNISFHPTASACKTRHQHQPSLLKTSRSLSLERPRGSQKPTGAWSPTRPSKPKYDFASFIFVQKIGISKVQGYTHQISSAFSVAFQSHAKVI